MGEFIPTIFDISNVKYNKIVYVTEVFYLYFFSFVMFLCNKSKIETNGRETSKLSF